MSEPDYLVYFGPKANCTLELCPIERSVYAYRPSLPVNISFAALFAIATALHVYLGLKRKSPWFMWCLILSCTHEIAGYVARIILYMNPWNFGAFITQIICITQAPVFYCAAIYVLLGQTMEHLAPSLARFPPKYVGWIFVTFDVVSLILQGTGGGLSASSSGASQVGVDVAMAGLILQVIMLFSFSMLFGDYMIRYTRSNETSVLKRRDRIFFAFLILAVVTTLARCIFRADELKEGYAGDLIKHEDLFIGLEGVPIVIAVFALGIAHPGFVFRHKAVTPYSSARHNESKDHDLSAYKPTGIVHTRS